MLSFFKKFSINRKPDVLATIATADIVSGGIISLAISSGIKVYRAEIEAKLRNLIIDVTMNGLHESELNSFINNASEKDREFIGNLIQKSLFSDNRLTTFLLAKLWVQKMRNGELNYYESSLLANINSLTYEDYKIFYNLIRVKTT